MNAKIQLLTERKFNSNLSHQVLYEWEDEFSQATGIDIVGLDDMKKHIVSRIAKKIEIIKPISYYPDQDIYLFFVMNIDHLKYTSFYKSNTIPIICDVEVREIPALLRLVKYLPIYFVTSLSLLKEIEKNYQSGKGVYVPQSVSTKWTGEHKPIIERNIDILQYGRRDPLLHDFALQYCDSHKGCTYMYRKNNKQGSEMVIYKNGNVLSMQVLKSRASFMDTLLNAKTVLCSTPLASHTRDFGKNIDFLTARWYESLAGGADIIAHVSDCVEEELQFTGLGEYIKRVECYEDFEIAVDLALKKEEYNNDSYKRILKNNTTQSRAVYIIEKIEEACKQ